MARVVTDTILLINPQGKTIETIPVTDEGLTLINTQLMIDYINKNLDAIIMDLLFYKDIIDYINATKLNDKLKDFDELKKRFSLIFNSVRDKYPNKYNNRLKDYKKYSRGFGFNFQVMGNFIDHKFDLISCSVENNEGMFSTQSIPLVPEVADRFYEITIYESDRYKKSGTEVKSIIFNLYVAKVFFYEYFDRYLSNDVVERITNIEDKLSNLKNKYFEDYHYIVDSFKYQIKSHRGICNYPVHFSIYILNKLIQEKDIKSLLTINDIIHNTIHSEIIDENGFNTIFEKLSGFICSLGLTDEYYCFCDMRNEYSAMDLVNIFAANLYNFQNTEEYRKLEEEYYGDERTRE